MARQHTFVQYLKSIAGAALIALGVFILFENLTEAAARVSDLLGISAEAAATLGVLIAVGLAASHVLQAYLFNHQEFLGNLCQISIPFWPMLLVSAGTVLLRDSLAGEVKVPKKISGRVHRSILRSTRKLESQSQPIETDRMPCS